MEVTSESVTEYSTYNDSLYEYMPFRERDFRERLRAFVTYPHMIIMLVLGFLAVAVNILSLIALFHIRNRMNSHYRLIVSLSASDLLIGISIVVYSANKVINPTYSMGYGPDSQRIISRCMYVVLRALNTTALNISLLNLMGMSIDHYLAINKPLHYPKLMNEQRVRLMILILWAIAFFCGYSDVFTGIFYYFELKDNYNYCEIADASPFQEEFITMAITAICLVVMLFIYTNIYRTVSHHRSPGEHQHMKHEERRNRRALVTTLLILGSFALCWIPNCLFQIVMIIRVRSSNGDVWLDPQFVRLAQTDKYLLNLLLLNSICDPIIYTVRTYEVQLGYKRMFSMCLRRPFLDRKRSGCNATSCSLLKIPYDTQVRSDSLNHHQLKNDTTAL